jgi:hypothetical protein
MFTFTTYRMPIWFPSILSTLMAFAVSIKPAMTLSTLPAESGLQGFPPSLAILGVTGIGFAWGLLITWGLAKTAAGNSR